MKDQNLVAIFDGTIDGFLNIVHAHYYRKLNFTDIVVENNYQVSLFEYVKIPTDLDKSVQVMNGIRKKLSNISYEYFYKAFHHHSPNRYIAIYNYLILSFKYGSKINRDLTNPYIYEVICLCKNVNTEVENFLGFTRFKKTKDNIYYGKIEPKNNIIEFLAHHFADRLNTEMWLIHDTIYKQIALYDRNDYKIIMVDKNPVFELAQEEELYQSLWKSFFNTIAIEDRVDYKLQRNNLPLWYRKNMTEFK